MEQPLLEETEPVSEKLDSRSSFSNQSDENDELDEEVPSVELIKSPLINKNSSSEQQIEKDKSKSCCCICCSCNWKSCLFISSIIITIVLGIILPVIFCIVIPDVAQDTVDHAQMELLYGHVYNPTQDSIDLNATMKISNIGMFGATMESTDATLFYENIKIGTLKLPKLSITANKPLIFTSINTLHVTNKSQFGRSISKLIQGNDIKWKIHTTVKASTKILGISLTQHVTLEKNLILPGIKIEDMTANNLRVLSGTNDRFLKAEADIKFFASSKIKFTLPDNVSFAVFSIINNIKLGESPLPAFTLKNGMNILKKVGMTIEKTSKNKIVLNKFFSDYTNKKNQFISMKGPTNNDLVITNIISLKAMIEGTKENLVIGGMVNEITANGWKTINPITGETLQIRGAYADAYNFFDVPIKITEMNAEMALINPIRYKVTLGIWPASFKYNCWKNYSSVIGRAYIDYGIDKNNNTIRDITLEPQKRTTMFAIAGPTYEQQNNGDKQECGIPHIMTVPYSCCFSTMMTASICRENPQFTSTSEPATIDFIPSKIYGNITAKVNNKFEVNIMYYQDFFPLYYSYEMYAGFVGDGELKCSAFEFY